MLKTETVGKQTIDSQAFDDYRTGIVEEFHSENIFFKRKLTQGAFWTAIDKELANQYFRDERWLFNFKYKDELKFIDHGTNGSPVTGVGFNINKR